MNTTDILSAYLDHVQTYAEHHGIPMLERTRLYTDLMNEGALAPFMTEEQTKRLTAIAYAMEQLWEAADDICTEANAIEEVM